MVNTGHTVTIHKNYALIKSPYITDIYKIFRSDDGLWRTDINNLLSWLDNKPANDSTSSILANSGRLSNVQYTSIHKDVYDLHERMGHASADAMCVALHGNPKTPSWTGSKLTCQQIRKVLTNDPCLICILSKRNLPKIHRNPLRTSRNFAPGQAITCDVVPNINPISITNDISFFVFTDIATGYIHCILTKSKNSNAFLEALALVLQFYNTYNCSTTTIMRSDMESNFISSEVEEYLSRHHISHEYSGPYTHQQNPVERYIQSIIKGTSTVLHSQLFLSPAFWSEALRYYVQIRNRTPNHKTGKSTPHHIITQQPVDLSTTFRFVFGEIILIGIPKQLRNSKFDIRNNIAIYLNYDDNSINTARIYNPSTTSISIASFVQKIDVSELQLYKWFTNIIYKHIKATPIQRIKDATYSFELQHQEHPSFNSDISSIISKNSSVPNHHLNSYIRKLLPLSINKYINNDTLPNKTSDIKKVINSASRNNNYKDKHHSISSYLSKVDATNSINIDPTLKQALNNSDKLQWMDALKLEVDSLFSNTLIPIDSADIPTNAWIVPTTTQLKIKRSAQDNSIEKYKARICIRGDLLSQFFDKSETFSPTISQITFTTLLQISIILNLKRSTLDEVAAFLYQDYPYESKPLITYLQPLVATSLGYDPSQLYSVRRHMYGTGGAGRAHFLANTKLLSDNGYTQSKLDPCLFYAFYTDSIIYIAIFVDDIIVFYSNNQLYNKLIELFKSRYKITTNDNGDSYLGISIKSLDQNTYMLHQPKLLQTIFDEFIPIIEQQKGISISKSTSPYLSASTIINDKQLSTDASIKTITIYQYQHLLGLLCYLVRSRPDIQCALSFAAMHTHTPTHQHYRNLLKIVAYLYNTKDKGLILRSQSCPNNNLDTFQLYCFVDAAYLVHPDSKSHTGYTISFGDTGTFYSKSTKQKLISTSSTHAELRALYTLLQDIIFIISLSTELQFPIKLPALIFTDNMILKDLSNNYANGIRKCKHFLMVLAFIKEQIEANYINVDYIPSTHNRADLLSKPIYGNDFTYKAQMILHNSPT